MRRLEGEIVGAYEDLKQATVYLADTSGIVARPRMSAPLAAAFAVLESEQAEVGLDALTPVTDLVPARRGV